MISYYIIILCVQSVKHLSRYVFYMQYMQWRLQCRGTGGVEPPTKEQIEACVPEVRMDKDFILFGCYMKPVASHKYLYAFNIISYCAKWSDRLHF